MSPEALLLFCLLKLPRGAASYQRAGSGSHSADVDLTNEGLGHTHVSHLLAIDTLAVAWFGRYSVPFKLDLD